jgi:hypothetical protein
MAVQAATSGRVRADVERPRFVPAHVLAYFGAIVGIAATGWLLASGWNRWPDGVRFSVSCAYFVGYAVLSAVLLRRRRPLPAGLLATMAVAVVPLVVYSFEKLIGAWPRGYPGAYSVFHEEILGSWIAMELTTVAVGLVAVWLVRFPFVLAPVAFVLWYLSMDLAPGIFGSKVSNDERAYISVAVGVGMIVAGLALDALRTRRYAFWWHVFGLLALSGSICWFTIEHDDAQTWGIVTAVSFAALLGGLPLRRATWVVFGALGLSSASCYWAFEAFERSWGFPFVLTGIGLAFLALGAIVDRRGGDWAAALRRRVRG